VIEREEDGLRRRPARTHANSMIRLHKARWPEDYPFSVIGPFVVRRRRAGRPQRSEDRTGPATSGGGRRPHLTRERKILTGSQRVLTVCYCANGLVPRHIGIGEPVHQREVSPRGVILVVTRG
jgi:hypothetical protein